MISNTFLSLLVIVEFLIAAIVCFTYDILIKDENIYTPCQISDVNFIADYVDFSNMNYEFLSNDSLHMHGWVTPIESSGTQAIKFSVQFYKRKAGNWENTVYNMLRRDLCKSAFDPTEFWFQYVQEIPPEDRSCPFQKGKKYYFNSIGDLTVTVPDPRFAGEYKIEMLFTSMETNETACANIFVEVYKH